jgi:hypothetical protein
MTSFYIGFLILGIAIIPTFPDGLPIDLIAPWIQISLDSTTILTIQEAFR